MTYSLMTHQNDKDISYILSIYKHPLVSRFINIDEENYWRYVTTTDNVYFYKVYENDVLVATVHLELSNRILNMSLLVFPEYQKRGVGASIIKDIQDGKFELDFDKIEVSIDESNITSIKLFEKMHFSFVAKNDELLEYVYLG